MTMVVAGLEGRHSGGPRTGGSAIRMRMTGVNSVGPSVRQSGEVVGRCCLALTLPADCCIHHLILPPALMLCLKASRLSLLLVMTSTSAPTST